MLQTMRALLAINLEIAALRRVASFQRELRSSPLAPSVSPAWTAPANMHIALRFLGDVDQGLAPGILDPLRDLVANVQNPRVQLGPVSAYPAGNAARLVTLPIGDSFGIIASFASRLDALLADIGFAPDARPFQPHISLCKLSQPTDVSAWLDSIEPLLMADVRLSDCAMYRVESPKSNSEYAAVDRFAFMLPQSRSLRPSKAPRQVSQRPGRRPSKNPPAPAAGAELAQIPPPPKLPSIPAPGDAPTSSPSPSSGTVRSSILPPAVEAVLPPEDGWE